jgi:hypothetical protein
MNLRTEISLLGILTIETVLLTVYSSQPQRSFTSKPSLHNYRPLRFSQCSHAQQKVLLSSFSASDNVLVTYVLTAKRRGCLESSALRSGGPLADGRQVGLDWAPDPGSGPPTTSNLDLLCGADRHPSSPFALSGSSVGQRGIFAQTTQLLVPAKQTISVS